LTTRSQLQVLAFECSKMILNAQAAHADCCLETAIVVLGIVRRLLQSLGMKSAPCTTCIALPRH